MRKFQDVPTLDKIIEHRSAESAMHSLSQNRENDLIKTHKDPFYESNLLKDLIHVPNKWSTLKTFADYKRHIFCDNFNAIKDALRRKIALHTKTSDITEEQVETFQRMISGAKNIGVKNPEIVLKEDEGVRSTLPPFMQFERESIKIRESRLRKDPEEIILDLYKKAVEMGKGTPPEELISKIRYAMKNIFEQFEEYHDFYEKELEITSERRLLKLKGALKKKEHPQDAFYEMGKVIRFFQEARSLRVPLMKEKEAFHNLFDGISQEEYDPDLLKLINFVTSFYLNRDVGD